MDIFAKLHSAAPDWLSLKPVGDCGVLAVCGAEISTAVNARVAALTAAVRGAALPGIGECVPAFASVLVYYDPLRTDYAAVAGALTKLARHCGSTAGTSGRVVEIPVCYGGEYGEDLPFVAAHAGLSHQEVVAVHSGRDYPIYMLGFLPGFPYLGGMDSRLFCPRLETPRTRIPAGSVGIGGEQTGIYPIVSPGGWRLIGRTPLRLFDPTGKTKPPYQAGDRIRFVPIDPARYRALAAEQGVE